MFIDTIIYGSIEINKQNRNVIQSKIANGPDYTNTKADTTTNTKRCMINKDIIIKVGQLTLFTNC